MSNDAGTEHAARWLDTTPVGRIITRCTQDIGVIDGSFSFFVGYWIRMTVALVTFLGSAILVAGWYAFFPAIIIACLGTFIGYIYVNCQLAIRRERSNAKAPIVGQVGAALSGLRKPLSLGCISISRAHFIRLH